MFVEWDPEDGSDKQTWVFDSGDVGRKDATLIEKHYGNAWDQWLAGLLQGQILARTVLLWFMLYKIHPQYRFDDVPDFRVRQLTVQMGVSELTDLWKRAKRIKLTADQRDAFEAQFTEDMKDALVREGKSPDFTIDGGTLAIEGSAELPKTQ